MIVNRYIFVGLLLLTAVVFAVGPLAIAALVAPRKRSATKADIYECGLRTTGETWVRFRIQYYIYALLFVVFDIETVFLYPWAVSYGELGRAAGASGEASWVAAAEMGVFLGVLAVGLAYAWAKGVLRWA